MEEANQCSTTGISIIGSKTEENNYNKLYTRICRGSEVPVQEQINKNT